MVKPIENKFNSRDLKNSELNKFLEQTSKWLEFYNYGLLEKRYCKCNILREFPDETYQCEVEAFPRLDWFGCYKKQYFEIVTVTTDGDYFDMKSVEAWQGGIMLEYANQGIKTFILVYFKKYRRIFAITMPIMKLFHKTLQTNLIPLKVVEGNSTELFWGQSEALDLQDLFNK